jgi:CRP/FNR family transcriptional regulator
MRPTCRTCAIRPSAVCRALPPEALDQINRLSHRKHLTAGRTLFAAEDGDHTVATVLAGVAKTSVTSADGRTQIVGLHFPGDFIGRPHAAGSANMVEAATDMDVCLFDKSRFEALLREHDGLSRLLMERMTEDLDAARQWMFLLGHKSAAERLASFIALCIDRLEPRCGADTEAKPASRIDLPLSRTEIGHFLGLTIETVSRVLRRLQTAGVIEIESGRGIRVVDREALAATASAATD